MAREIICDSCGERGQDNRIALPDGHMQVILRLGGPHGDARDEINIDLCAVCRKELKDYAYLVKEGKVNLRKER